jgi:hypothetical protein
MGVAPHLILPRDTGRHGHPRPIATRRDGELPSRSCGGARMGGQTRPRARVEHRCHQDRATAGNRDRPVATGRHRGRLRLVDRTGLSCPSLDEITRGLDRVRGWSSRTGVACGRESRGASSPVGANGWPATLDQSRAYAAHPFRETSGQELPPDRERSWRRRHSSPKCGPSLVRVNRPSSPPSRDWRLGASAYDQGTWTMPGRAARLPEAPNA